MISQTDFLGTLNVKPPRAPLIPPDAYKFKVCPNVHARDWSGDWHPATRCPSLHTFAIYYGAAWWAFCDHDDGNGKPHGPHRSLAAALHDTRAANAREPFTTPTFPTQP